jgi:hypothetical protein
MKRRIRQAVLAGSVIVMGALVPAALQAAYPCSDCVQRYNSCMASGADPATCQRSYELCTARCDL